MGLELHTVTGTDGQKTVVIESTVDAEVAWEIVKWLEGLGPEDFPLILDLSRAQFVNWFGAEILKSGVQSLNRKTGPIHLKFGSGTIKIHG